MLAMKNEMDLEKLNEAIEGPARSYFISSYPDLMVWYDQHIMSGLDCPLVQATLKALWQQEMERDAKSFQESLAGGNW